MNGRVIAFSLSAAVVAGAFCVQPSPPGEKTAVELYGPKLGSAFEVLFNDMKLVDEKKFGVARDPLANLHLRQDNEPLEPCQVAIDDLAENIKASGFDLEEGLFVSSDLNMRPLSRSVSGSKQVSDGKLAPIAYPVMWRSADFRRRKTTMFQDKMVVQMSADPALIAFAKEVFPKAKSKPYTTAKNGFTVYALPIHFQHKECLTCHAAAKLNDTAAVIAFAFKKQATTAR